MVEIIIDLDYNSSIFEQICEEVHTLTGLSLEGLRNLLIIKRILVQNNAIFRSKCHAKSGHFGFG